MARSPLPSVEWAYLASPVCRQALASSRPTQDPSVVQLLHLKLGGQSAQFLTKATGLQFQLFFSQTFASEPCKTDTLNPSYSPLSLGIEKREVHGWSPSIQFSALFTDEGIAGVVPWDCPDCS